MAGSSQSLMELTQVPEEKRDKNWENKFLVELTSTNIRLLSPDPQYGPDNWPYLMAVTDEAADEPAQKVIQWLAQKGIGLVINPHKEYPDYIFSYGMLWSFVETGFFFKPVATDNGTFTFEPGQNVIAGEPTLEYLPTYSRNILREFLRDQGVLAPKILVLSQDKLNYDLAFSLESLGNPPDSEFEGIAEAFSWFLPPHYSILLISENGLPKFVNL